MAFVKKTWTDRMSQYPTRRVLTDTTTGTTQTVTVARSEGEVSQAGDAFSASTMNDLENRIEAGINAAHSDADVLLPSTVGWTGKNQIVYPYVFSYDSLSGVTFTVMSDGTIKLNNTANASINKALHFRSGYSEGTTVDNYPVVLKAGSYIVSKRQNENVSIRINKTVSGSASNIVVLAANEESASFTISEDTQIGILLDIASGASFSDTIIHPMIRDARITDSTYEPYHDTVDECKLDNEAVAPVEKTSTASQAYAVGDYFVKDGKLCKVTQAISSGGALTKNTNYTETLVADELGGGGISGIVPTSLGGTGNADGYIRTGQKANTTIGTSATIEGYDNTGSGNYSHTEGSNNKATANCAHAEGMSTEASSSNAHAEGNGSKATGTSSHAENTSNTASGNNSHAGGNNSTAGGTYSFAHGRDISIGTGGQYAAGFGQGTVANYNHQFVAGKYNNNKSGDIFEVGIGTGTNARANGLELDTSGNLKVAGSVTDGNGNTLGGGGNKVVTIDVPGSSAVTGQYFNVTLSALPSISVGDILVLAIHCNHTFSGSTGAGWGLSITVDSSTTTWGSNLFRNYPEQTSSSSFFTSVFKDSFVPTGKVFTFVCFEMSGTTPQFLMIAEENAQPGEQTVTLSTSSTTTVTFTRDDITTASVVEVGISEWGLVPDDVVCSAGSCTVTLPKVSSAHSVTVRLYVR